MPFTKAALTPHGHRLFEEIRSRLPPEIAKRLRSSRTFITHGQRKSQYLFEIWDRSQNGVLPRQYFKYCIVYDYLRLNRSTKDGFFHLWLSTIRIYRQRKEIKRYLEREIRKAAPKGFDLDFCDGRAISCGKTFNWPNDLHKIDSVILDDVAQLIGAIHPVLVPIIDRFTELDFTSKDRHLEVARRGRIAIGHAGPLDRAKVRKYTRSIPPKWRAQLLTEAKHRCVICGADLRKEGHHIDHIVAFSEGGDTVYENLRAICPNCNLKKGKKPALTPVRKPRIKKALPAKRRSKVQPERILPPSPSSAPLQEANPGPNSETTQCPIPEPVSGAAPTPSMPDRPASPGIWSRLKAIVGIGASARSNQDTLSARAPDSGQ